jgi:hypothetical protein
MGLSEKIIQNQNNVAEGKHNYIPNPPELGLLAVEWPGRLKGDMTCLTAGSSVGKSTLARFMILKPLCKSFGFFIAKYQQLFQLWKVRFLFCFAQLYIG